MNRLAQPAIVDVRDVLNRLRDHRVIVWDPDRVAAYLTDHRELSSLVAEICQRTRDAFGGAVELSMQVYVDPEFDDRYLTLYVRQEPYQPNLIEQIEAVSAEFHERLEAVPGYFLITTDFRRPRGADAV